MWRRSLPRNGGSVHAPIMADFFSECKRKLNNEEGINSNFQLVGQPVKGGPADVSNEAPCIIVVV